MILSFFNTKKTFFQKSVKSLVKQSYIYFVFMSLIYILYVFGAVDKIKNNWENLLCSLGLLCIIWSILNIAIIFFCTMVVAKWEHLEDYAKTFCKFFFIFN